MNTLVTVSLLLAFVWYVVGTFTYAQWISNQTKLKNNPDAWRAYANKYILSLSGKLRAPMYYMFVLYLPYNDYVDVGDDPPIFPVLLAGCFSALGGMLLIVFALLAMDPFVPVCIILGVTSIYGAYRLGNRI